MRLPYIVQPHEEVLILAHVMPDENNTTSHWRVSILVQQKSRMLQSSDGVSFRTVSVLLFHHVILLIQSVGALSELICSHQPIVALAGDDVILPCHLEPAVSAGSETVVWTKPGLDPKYIHFHHDGRLMFQRQNPSYHYRTILFVDQLTKGNVSLKIFSVKISDAGKYLCILPSMQKEASVQLTVGAVSEPKLSVISAKSGGVTLQCEADCWLPKPELTFVDDEGNNIPADAPKRDQDARGCYTVTQRVTLQHPTNRVTCRVHQPEINQTRDTQILIPDDYVRSCSLMTAIAVGEAILLLSATLCGLAVMLWKRCGRSAERKEQSVTRQSSDQITVSGTSGNQLLLQRARVCSADTVENSSFEALTRIVADLKSKLSEKEETNRPQQRDLKSNVVCSPAASSDSNPPVAHSFPQNQVLTPSISQQHGNPASDCPVSRKRHNNSSPAVLDFKVPVLSGSFSANILQKKIHRRSISEPTAQLRPSVPKLQRRHSSALTTLSNNRFTLLADLPEESELLVP